MQWSLSGLRILLPHVNWPWSWAERTQFTFEVCLSSLLPPSLPPTVKIWSRLTLISSKKIPERAGWVVFSTNWDSFEFPEIAEHGWAQVCLQQPSPHAFLASGLWKISNYWSRTRVHWAFGFWFPGNSEEAKGQVTILVNPLSSLSDPDPLTLFPEFLILYIW